METIRLTVGQAIVKFLDNQFVEFDGKVEKFVGGVVGNFGHGVVVGLGEALAAPGHGLTFIQAKNEQGAGHIAIGYAKQNNRRKIMAVTSSIGPGALNMATAAGTATVNHIPVLFLPGDVFADRQPDPVLQQLEVPHDYTISANDAFRPLSRYFDRITRPEQVMTAFLHAMSVLTDPAQGSAVKIALPQDVQGEAYDYPVEFFDQRIHHIERRPPTSAQIERLAGLLKEAKRPFIICWGGVRYSEAGRALANFCKKFGIPFGETQVGKGTVFWDHPCNLSGIGVTGSLAANRLAKEADLVIGVGTRFGDFTTCSKWLFQNPSVKFVSINVAPFDAYKMNAESIIADAKLTLTAVSRALGAIAKQKGMQLTYHHHMGTGVQTSEEIDRLMEMTDPELVGLLYDTGHLVFSGEDHLAVLKKYVKRIKHVHLKNVRFEMLEKAKREKWSFLQAVRNGTFTVPGDGGLDFVPVFETLKSAGYTGWWVVEAE